MRDELLRAWVYLGHEVEHGLLIVVPEGGQFEARRELLAAELEGQLEAVARQIVEVLHASTHRVPGEKQTPSKRSLLCAVAYQAAPLVMPL